MEDNSLLRAKLDKKGVPEKEYYEIQTEKGYSKYYNLYSMSTNSKQEQLGKRFNNFSCRVLFNLLHKSRIRNQSHRMYWAMVIH